MLSDVRYEIVNKRRVPVLVAQSPAMKAIMSRLDPIAASDSTVLLIGETGVGKELVAEYIHSISPRSSRPFIKVGLSTLPPDLIESELFGHTRGAFTSASSEKKGLFELSDSGTIFLDDVDDFPLHLQSKLLRILESGELMRVGGAGPSTIDVRVICSTKVDLKAMMDRGLFRADLYYRVNVVPLVIPPLRERRDCIPSLVDHFLHRYNQDALSRFTPEAMRTLVGYSWPGNVRELRNIVHRVSLLTHNPVQVEDLPSEIREEKSLEVRTKECERCFSDDGMTLQEVVQCLEANLLRHALEAAGGNKLRAAKLLGTSPSTMRDKLKKYHLDSGL